MPGLAALSPGHPIIPAPRDDRTPFSNKYRIITVTSRTFIICNAYSRKSPCSDLNVTLSYDHVIPNDWSRVEPAPWIRLIADISTSVPCIKHRDFSVMREIGVVGCTSYRGLIRAAMYAVDSSVAEVPPTRVYIALQPSLGRLALFSRLRKGRHDSMTTLTLTRAAGSIHVAAYWCGKHIFR